MSKNNIYYTGIGSIKSGNHTTKQFLKIMNKHFKTKCAIYIKSLKCKSCIKSIKINNKEVKKQINAQLKNKVYKMSKITEKKLVEQINKCKLCKTNNTEICNLNKYLLYSGAEIGKSYK